jgi:hypothetical protein
MTERTNVPVLKTGVGLPTVGSNPTPSAKCLIPSVLDPKRSLRDSGRDKLANKTRPDYSLVVATVTMLSDVLVTVLIVT